jgi:hypothetical protein
VVVRHGYRRGGARARAPVRRGGSEESGLAAWLVRAERSGGRTAGCWVWGGGDRICWCVRVCLLGANCEVRGREAGETRELT